MGARGLTTPGGTSPALAGDVGLARARAILDGGIPVHQRHRVRVAAWFARVGLEDALISRLEAHGVSTGKANMRSRLCCLRVLDPEVADDAEVAWWGLSRICHHPAFELTPVASEVRHLVGLVENVTRAPVAGPERALKEAVGGGPSAHGCA